MRDQLAYVELDAIDFSAVTVIKMFNFILYDMLDQTRAARRALDLRPPLVELVELRGGADLARAARRASGPMIFICDLTRDATQGLKPHIVWPRAPARSRVGPAS